ncbi:MAG: DUF1080 domain-containing protein [Bryobacterales bacterium]|nr:DUF1080 domain-containing protein [Bryobacterales bacterium]
MRWLCLLLVAGGLWAQSANTLTPKEVEDGWVLLFDGETLFGWKPVGPSKWDVKDGAIVTEPSGQGWLRSGSQFADYILKLEFRAEEKANSGLFLRSATEGQPHETGYEVQIWNVNPNAKYRTGSLVNHVSAKKAAFKGAEWNSYEIQVNGDKWNVKLNGKSILKATEGKSKVGHIGLQSNGFKMEFRNIKLKPLNLQPIFDGKSLTGWHKVDAPKAQQPPEWSAKNGMIHVEKGPGELETDGQYDDAILQIAIRTNANGPAHHPNSGVFLRGDANKFWTGYESQIRNEYKDGDRTKPVDFGTGAIYHYQPTRKVVPNDNEFFVKTIVMRGRHFGIWINGYPVTDWEDPHPEGNVVRNKQAKLGAGTISLQAHDPTTNLDFKNIRLAKLPR